jgi:hypothetical protein
VATTNRKIYSIARNLLDPRRPNRKLTSEEQEVYMVQYDPVLLDDPRRTLSHTYEVSGYLGRSSPTPDQPHTRSQTYAAS